jgi:hypothetical protein
MMTEAEVKVRKGLEKALRRRMYDTVWNRLVRDQLVSEYLDRVSGVDSEGAFKDLKDIAEEKQRDAEDAVSEVLGGGRVAHVESRGGLVSVVRGLIPLK